MTALAAPESGVQTHSHLAVARERTSGSQPSIGALAFASNPGWSYLADRQAPSYAAPVIVGQAGQVAFEASVQQARDEVAAAQAKNAAEAQRDPMRRLQWEVAAKAHTRELHEAVRIPTDSAGPAEREAAGPAEASTGEAE